MDENQKIQISVGRFAQLVEMETRINIIVERIEHEEYMNTEDLLWALGTELSVELAQKMRDEKNREKEKWEETRCSAELDE